MWDVNKLKAAGARSSLTEFIERPLGQMNCAAQKDPNKVVITALYLAIQIWKPLLKLCKSQF